MLRITILPTPRTVTCTDISAVVRHGGRGVSESATSGFRGRVTPDPGRGFLRVYCRLHSELICKLRIVSPHSNTSDQPCHLQYRCVTTTVKRAQASIQIKWKRSETRSRCLPRRWTSPPPPRSLKISDLGCQITISDSHAAGKTTTHLKYKLLSLRKNNSSKLKEINADNLHRQILRKRK